MRTPLAVTLAELSLAIADVQWAIVKAWPRLTEPFLRWAVHRREMAYQRLQEWPVSMGGTGPERHR